MEKYVREQFNLNAKTQPFSFQHNIPSPRRLRNQLSKTLPVRAFPVMSMCSGIISKDNISLCVRKKCGQT
jgi:hypothetical protein